MLKTLPQLTFSRSYLKWSLFSGEKQVEGMSDFEQAFGAPGGQAAAPNGQPDQAANDPAQAAVGMLEEMLKKHKIIFLDLR